MIPRIRIRSASKPTHVLSQTQSNFSPVKLHQMTWTSSAPFFDINKTTPKSILIPPIVTATAWGIHDVNTGEMLWGKKADEQREMASLTKIMTCYLSYQLLIRFGEDPEKLSFTVSRLAAKIIGTHSGLRENETIKVIDLLYGLMLPSGNDCAITLAQGFGSMLLKNKKSKLIGQFPQNPIYEFIKEMNKLAAKLGLRATCFTNPHGLSEKGNKSTVSDLGKLAFYALEIPLIEAIGSTQTHTAEVVDSQGNTRALSWRNTNKLLEKGFLGLKTGTTPNAGLCLSSVLKCGKIGVIVTLLNTKTEEHRWGESEKLARWALHNLKSSSKGRIESYSEVSRGKLVAKIRMNFSRASNRSREL